MLKSNGLCHSKNLPVKFGFSPKIVPAYIVKKLPSQCCSKPLLIPFFNLSHKWPTFAFTPKAGTHSAFGERSHTSAYTSKQGAFLPRPQRGLVLPAESLQSTTFATLDSAVLLYTYISRFSVDHHHQQQLHLRPSFIALFNFSHKRPTFAFTSESGYTLGFRRKIAHKGTHGETGGVSDGGGITTLGAFHTFRKPCVAGYQNGKLCRFWALVGGALEERRKPSEQRCAHARRCSEASRPRRAA